MLKFMEVSKSGRDGGEGGFVLVGLVFTMVAFAVIGAALSPMLSTSTRDQVSASLAQKAYYNAESGYRYAASQYLHGATDEARDLVLRGLDGATFQLAGNEGTFQYVIQTYYFQYRGAVGNALRGEPFGGMPSGIGSSGTGGSLMVWTSSSASGQRKTDYASYGYNANTNEITFSTTGTAPASGSRIYPIAYYASAPAGPTVTKGGDIQLPSGVDLSLVAPVNGLFRIMTVTDSKFDGKDAFKDLLAYRTFDAVNRRLVGVTNIENPGDLLGGTIAAGDALVFQRAIKLYSKGRAGSGTSTMLATRNLLYNVNAEALLGGSGGGETPEEEVTPSDMLSGDSPGRGTGNWAQGNVDGDDALIITATTGGQEQGKKGITFSMADEDGGKQPRVEAFIAVPKKSLLYKAWDGQNHFLNYDFQLKMATGTLSSDEDGTLTAPDAYFYFGGPVFRLNKDKLQGTGNWETLGLAFMSHTGLSSDGIPVNLLPGGQANKPLVVLWERGGRNPAADEWIAYHNIPETDNVLKESSIEAWVSGWKYNAGNAVENDDVTYRCLVGHTSSSANEPGPPPPPDSWTSGDDYIKYQLVLHDGVVYECKEGHTAGRKTEPGTGKDWTDYWKAVEHWATYWEVYEEGSVRHLTNWSTLMVRIIEAAAVTLNTTTPTAFEKGDAVTGSGGTGVVIDKIYDASGYEVLLLNKIEKSGSGPVFVAGSDLVGGHRVTDYRERDNYIRAFYGDTKSGGGDEYLHDSDRAANPRNEINWVQDKLADPVSPTAEDRFTIVTWSGTNGNYGSNVAIYQDRLYNGTLKQTVIRTGLFLTGDDYFTCGGTCDGDPYELGIMAYGYESMKTYFDDIAYYVKGDIDDDTNPIGFLSAVVQ